MSILLFVDSAVNTLTLQNITTAKRLASELNTTFSLALFGSQLEVESAVNKIKNCGAEKIYVVQGDDFAQSRYSSDFQAMTSLIKSLEASLVLAPSRARFRRTLPAAASSLGYSVDTQIVALDVVSGELQAQKWFYRQRIKGTFVREGKGCFLLEEGLDGVWQDDNSAGEVEVENISVELEPQTTKVIAVESLSEDSRTIRPEAELLLVAGAGWTKKQANPDNTPQKAAELISCFLDKTRASLGSSKSLVDQGAEGQQVLPFLTHLNQVGQTGSTPHHQKGLATCCHGEEPHVVGWRFINERRVVNSDANCGWVHGKADVVYVADAFAVLEELNKLL